MVVKSHGFEFGSKPSRGSVGVVMPLPGCSGVKLKHGYLARISSGEMLGDHELMVSNPDGKDALATLLVFSRHVTPGEAALKLRATLVIGLILL